MARAFDIVAVGECLMDFVGEKQGEKIILEGNPGGAPANALAMAARLGLSTAMISKVGDDGFGAFLRGQIAAAGVDVEHVLRSAQHPTTLAMVQLDETGNRSFRFYRNQTADVMLRTDELPLELIRAAGVLHFGSVSLTCEPARSATLAAAREARAAGVCVSYDANLRPKLWESLAKAKEIILQGLLLADLVKLSDEELVFLSGCEELRKGLEELFERYPMKLLAVTLGPKGCMCRTQAGYFAAKTFDTKCIDTTGAGDAFWGATLGWTLTHGGEPERWGAREVNALMDFANAAGSLAATKKGAIPAMPCRADIEECIRAVPRLNQ